MVDLLINTGGKLGEGTLDECALVESRTEENSVKTEQDPCAFAEGKSRQEESSPERNFKRCNEHHATVIVFLDKLADHSGQTTLRLWWLWRLSCSCDRGSFGWLEGWDQIGTGVCGNVED